MPHVEPIRRRADASPWPCHACGSHDVLDRLLLKLGNGLAMHRLTCRRCGVVEHSDRPAPSDQQPPGAIGNALLSDHTFRCACLPCLPDRQAECMQGHDGQVGSARSAGNL